MAAPFKLSFTTKTGLNPLKKPSSSTSKGEPPAKRPRLLGDEPEEKDDTIEITAWDATAGGAIGVDGRKEEKGPLVIPALPNRGNWASLGKSKGREAPGKKKGETDKENRSQKAKPEEEEGHEEQPASYGLTIMRKSPAPTTRPDGAAEATTITTSQAPETEEDAHLTEEQRLEKRALAALLNPDAAADKTVIPIHPDEEAAFSHDYASAPDAPDLDDYAAVPVEGFGAALLRGMGWKDGEEIGRKRVGGSTTASSANKKSGAAAAKPHEIKRRPEFLGIGAKEDKVVGGNDKASFSKRETRDGKVVEGYVPVVARILSTGELITREELEERQKLGEEKEEGRGREKDKERDRPRDRYDDDSYEEEKRRERKRRERDRERERERDRTPDSKTSKDDRRRDRDRDYARDRRRDDDRDSRDGREKRDRSRDRDRERRKEKERERERRRDDYDSYDEERRREKRRERERRDRDRDRERDRDRDSDERRKRRREDEVEGADDRKKRYR